MKLPVSLAVSVLLALAVSPVRATSAFDPTQAEAKATTRWARLELLRDPDPHLGEEPYIPLVERRSREIRAAFGSARPPSSLVLLHYAAGWDHARMGPPVVLVHGAGLSANECWADHPFQQPYPGLAATLAEAGRAVFAVTFAHMQGDNFRQAEALADAIVRVREVTGAAKVDLVAHSKGGMAARIYLSDAGPPWTTRYRGDVRRYVMLGVPNGGLDVSFAYPTLNHWILEHRSPAPLSWTRCLYYGKWIDTSHQTLYGPDSPFGGQAQMLARWDGRYGRARGPEQLDGDATYDGTRGQVSVSLGIDRAIEDGGHTIARLQNKGVAPGVELCLLAGRSPWIIHLVGERRGPSDGLLLTASALDTRGLTRRGAKVHRTSILLLNHLQLVYHPRANRWVEEALSR